MARSMRAFAKTSAMAAVAAAWLILLSGCAVVAQGPEGAEQRVRDLEQDIELLRELNRLDLTKEQLTQLITITEELRRYLDGRDELRRDVFVRLEAQLEAQREALLKDQAAPPAVDAQIDELVAELTDFGNNTEQELLASFALRIKDVLTGDQVAILTWASEAKMQAIGYLDWAREMSAEDFAQEAPIAAESLAEGREIEAGEIAEILATARDLDEAEYEAARDMLAEKLMPALLDDEASPDLILVRRMQAPRLLPLLKEKLARMP